MMHDWKVGLNLKKIKNKIETAERRSKPKTKKPSPKSKSTNEKSSFIFCNCVYVIIVDKLID